MKRNIQNSKRSPISMVAHHSLNNSGSWQVMEEAVNEQYLTYRATTLYSLGLGPMEIIEKAVERAMTVCSENGVLVEEHFKTVYISDNNSHSLSKDWKLSRLAYTLVLINTCSDNPLVGRMQLELLNAYLEKIDGTLHEAESFSL
jgi:hypothetical protein